MPTTKTELSNPALKEIAFLRGEWTMVLSNAAFLADPTATAEMPVSFEWVGEGAAMMMRQGNRPPSPPAATWIMGRDESKAEYSVLYSDARGVSRIYEMSFANGLWKMWRNHAEFSQRFEGRVGPEANVISAHWEKSMDGRKTWQHDFDMTFRRR